MSPRLSIGIPFLDAAETLPAAIRSVFAQTETDWELLLLDDGSRDGSLEIAESVDDPRVRVIKGDRSAGVSVRQNQFTEQASSDIVARMDADDVMHPRRLEIQLALLERSPRNALVCSPAYLIDLEGRVIGRARQRALTADPALFLLNDRVIVTPTVMARRELFLDNPLDPTHHGLEDKEWYARVHPRVVLARTGEPLLFYRHSPRPSLERYRSHRWKERRILRRHGPARIGALRTTAALAGSLAREELYRGLHRSGHAERVYRRFSARHIDPLSPAERRRAEADLVRSLAAPVPGWD